jgi:hypothetical protein
MPMCTTVNGSAKPTFITETGANKLAQANAVAANELFRYLYGGEPQTVKPPTAPQTAASPTPARQESN